MQIVLLTDVDVVPNLDLSAELLKPKVRKELREKLQEGYALVLPVLDVVEAASEEETLAFAKRVLTGDSSSWGADDTVGHCSAVQCSLLASPSLDHMECCCIELQPSGMSG